MSGPEENTVRFVWKPHGRKGVVGITVELPGGEPAYTDKLDVTRMRDRERFLGELCERQPGLDRGVAREQLELIAAEVVGGRRGEPTDDLGGLDDLDDFDSSVSDRLVKLAMKKFQLGRSSKNEPFAVPIDGPKYARLLKAGNSLFRAELARDFFREEKKVPGGTAIADAMQVLIGEAMESEPEELHLRVAARDGSIVLDLGDEAGNVAIVSPSGWRVSTDSPALFRRTQLTGGLPVPMSGGSLDELKELLNVTAETWPLVVGNLVAALIPDINHPAVLMGGQQGTGKSTGASVIARIIDPGPAVLRTPPRDIEQWALNASASWVVVVDNVSRIPDWWSDAICRAVTGDGLVRRQLYTDDDLSVLAFRRVVMLTSIDAGALKGDLGDRILLVDLLPITGKKRAYEKALWKRFREAHPRILGALLDVVSNVLAVLPDVELAEKSRMADFHQALVAVDRVLGIGAADCYVGQRERIATEVVESDAVAEALRAWAMRVGDWSGPARELLEILTPDSPPRGWPTTARGLSGRVRRVIPALLQLGIEVVPPSEEGRSTNPKRSRLFRVYCERRNPQATVQTVQTVHPSEHLDGLDGLDGSTRASNRDEGSEWGEL